MLVNFFKMELEPPSPCEFNFPVNLSDLRCKSRGVIDEACCKAFEALTSEDQMLYNQSCQEHSQLSREKSDPMTDQ